MKARWEYEIDWMALHGINLVYAHTAAEFIWVLTWICLIFFKINFLLFFKIQISVYQSLGFTRQEIDDFFTGPAYLAWFRMGNIKHFGGSLTDAWHYDQVNLQKNITQRMTELGINYILPAFAGFVPDAIKRLFPEQNLTISNSWSGFSCNESCTYILDPLSDLFQKIGSMYVKQVK
jgi:alpha-N-acetylglucosaminidase